MSVADFFHRILGLGCRILDGLAGIVHRVGNGLGQFVGPRLNGVAHILGGIGKALSGILVGDEIVGHRSPGGSPNQYWNQGKGHLDLLCNSDRERQLFGVVPDQIIQRDTPNSANHGTCNHTPRTEMTAVGKGNLRRQPGAARPTHGGRSPDEQIHKPALGHAFPL